MIEFNQFTMTTQLEELRHQIRSMVHDEIESFYRTNPDKFSGRLDNTDTVNRSGNSDAFSVLNYHLYYFLIWFYPTLYLNLVTDH